MFSLFYLLFSSRKWFNDSLYSMKYFVPIVVGDILIMAYAVFKLGLG